MVSSHYSSYLGNYYCGKCEKRNLGRVIRLKDNECNTIEIRYECSECRTWWVI